MQSRRTTYRRIIAALVFCCTFAGAQQNSDPTQPADESRKSSIPTRQEQVIVTGTYQPVAVNDADRDVTVINVRDTRYLYPSWTDALRADPAVDLQQRGPNDVQADLSIRGSSYEQTLVLIDGLRMNAVQSGHHNLDIPLPFQSIDRIEVLNGPGSTMYGADAMGGVVNFITAPPLGTELKLGSSLGNFGINQQYGAASFVAKTWTEQLSFGRDFSTGFIPDRDYRILTGSSETHLQTGLGATTLLLAGGDKPFGASDFYGPYPEWERTKSWFAGVSQELGANTLASFGYRRHTDLFELFRDDPSAYTNNHITDDLQLAIRRHDDLRKNLNVFYGVEGFRDTIDSNNFSGGVTSPALGQHARNSGGIYADLEWRPLQPLTLSAGAREEDYSGGHGVFTPTFSGGYRLSERWKLRGSAAKAFRLPTYTDLYYQDPVTQGNPNLQPETAWGYDGGVEFTISRRLTASVTGFYRHENNDVDWVFVPIGTPLTTPLNLIPQVCPSQTTAGCIAQARNLDTVNFTGVEAAVRWQVTPANQVTFAYMGLHGAQGALDGLSSLYVFNYPVNSGSVQWQTRLPGAVELRTRVGLTERFDNDAYAIWDLALARQFRQVRPFLQLSNLGNTAYEERQGIPMPGRTIVGGMEILLSRAPLKK